MWHSINGTSDLYSRSELSMTWPKLRWHWFKNSTQVWKVMKNRNSISSKPLRMTENNFQHQLIKFSAIDSKLQSMPQRNGENPCQVRAHIRIHISACLGLHNNEDCGNNWFNLHWTPTGFQPMDHVEDESEYEYELWLDANNMVKDVCLHKIRV